jgi:hypothetical protein
MRKNTQFTLNKNLLETLCSYQAEVKEITDLLGVKLKDLKVAVKKEYGKSWAEFYQEHSSKGKVKIRENQFKLSSKSPDMAKHLGKKYLDNRKPKEGRPRIWETAEGLQTAIDMYFEEMDNLKKPYTITGLTLALGFEDRRSLLDYQNNEKFGAIVKKAKTRVESYYEEALHSGQVVAGIIFGLKANFKWQDKTTIETQLLDKDGKPADPTPPATIINKTYIQPKNVSTNS